MTSPAVTPSLRSFCSEDARGSTVTVMLEKARAITASLSGLPDVLAICAFTTPGACAALALIQSTASTCPRSSAATVSGCCCKNVVATIRWVVTNCPLGHRSFSSTSTFAPASITSRDAHGSGTHAPSRRPCWNSWNVWAFSVGVIATSPPPFGVVFRPWPASQARSATSCVPPS